jgi:pimeloyl-ACP methyl ester carboxylesterase
MKGENAFICLTGHGLSSEYPPGMFLNYYDHVFHVKLVIDYFKWEKVTIMGHSMGALTGIYFASIFPELTEKFISLDAIKQLSAADQFTPTRMNSVIQKFQKIVKNMEKPRLTYSYEEAREKMIEGYGGSISETEADILLKRNLIKVGEDKYQYTWDLRTTIRPYLFTDFNTEQLKVFGRGIRCPFLLIKAKDAPLFEAKELYLEFLDIYQNSSSDFRYVQVEGRHHVHLSNPKIVLPHIIDFLYPKENVKSNL